METLDLIPYADTPLGLESGLADGSEFWASVVAAVYAFHQLPKERPALPEGPVDEALRGQVFGWWDEVPAWLKTKTQWGEAGRKLAKEAAPFAAIEYGRGRRYRRHDLYAVGDTVAMREANPLVAAAAAEAAFRAGRMRVG